jgi:hypothetical protein
MEKGPSTHELTYKKIIKFEMFTSRFVIPEKYFQKAILERILNNKLKLILQSLA